MVVESPRYLQRRLFGILSIPAFDSTLDSPLLTSPAGFKLDLDQLHLKADSVPRASFDSSLFAATTMVNRRRETMQLTLGGFDVPLVLLVVTDVRNGMSGAWSSGNSPDAVRGFFCAFPK